MDLSIVLARVFGLYLLLVIPAVWLNRRLFPDLVRRFSSDTALLLVTGFIHVLLGLALVVTHNIWTPDWRGLITAIGWFTLARGLVRFYAPQSVGRLVQWAMGRRFWIFLGLWFVVGVYLTVIGFTR